MKEINDINDMKEFVEYIKSTSDQRRAEHKQIMDIGKQAIKNMKLMMSCYNQEPLIVEVLNPNKKLKGKI